MGTRLSRNGDTYTSTGTYVFAMPLPPHYYHAIIYLPFLFSVFFFIFNLTSNNNRSNKTKKRKQPLLFNYYYYYDKKITSTRSVFHTSTHINYLLQTTHA